MVGQDDVEGVAAVKSMADGLKQFYVPSNPNNDTRKYIKDWTSRDLQVVGPDDLDMLRLVLTEEKYNLTDQLLPKDMSRADFLRAVLRETARRGDSISVHYAEILLKVPEQRSKEVRLIRTAFGGLQAVPQEVQESAGVIAVRDAAVDVVLNNPANPTFQRDLMSLVGATKRTGLALQTDVDAYDLGYTTGSMKEFNGQGALSITATSPLTIEQFQAAYCPVVDKLFQEGRMYDNRDSFLTGFVQARTDAKTNFEPVNEHVGLIAQCLPAKPATNDNKLVQRR